MMSPYDGVSQQVPRVRPEAFLNPRGFPCISPALSHTRRIIAGILRPFAYRRWAFAYLYDPTSAMVRRPHSGTNHHGRKAHTIMTLTKKQIKQLKAMAHHLNPIIQVGKNDLSDAAVKQAEESKTGVAHLLKVSRSVLNDPTLGSYDEDMYRALLHAALVSKKITKADKEPFQRDLVMLEVNNAGSAAIDFEITGADGAKSRLSDVESPITVLFLYEPGAVDSKLERFRLSQARIANYLMQAGGLKIVAMACTSDAALWEKNRSDIPAEWVSGYDAGDVIRNEGLYDLRVMPRLYLLDEKKVVLLKNTNTDGVEEYLYDVLRAAAKQQQAAAGQTAGGGSDASTDAAAAK